jgi:hypothetical protein
LVRGENICRASGFYGLHPLYCHCYILRIRRYQYWRSSLKFQTNCQGTYDALEAQQNSFLPPYTPNHSIWLSKAHIAKRSCHHHHYSSQ